MCALYAWHGWQIAAGCVGFFIFFFLQQCVLQELQLVVDEYVLINEREREADILVGECVCVYASSYHFRNSTGSS